MKKQKRKEPVKKKALDKALMKKDIKDPISGGNFYAWEFLRRNAKYREHFNTFKEASRGAFFAGYPRKKGETSKEYFARLEQEKVDTDVLEWTTVNGFLRKTYGLIRLVDPNKSASKFSEGELKSYLFESCPVLHCLDRYDVKEVVREDIPSRFLFVRIDLEYKKESILREFNTIYDYKNELYIAGKLMGKKEGKRREHYEKYDTYLRVWDYRKMKLAFSEIAQKVYPEKHEKNKRTAINLVYKNYAKVYEEIYKEKYRPKIFKDKLNNNAIEKEDHEDMCKKCSDQKCVKNFTLGGEWHPCPEKIEFIKRYIDQDQVALKEFQVKKKKGKGPLDLEDYTSDKASKAIEREKHLIKRMDESIKN